MTMTRTEVETSWGRIPVRRGGEGPAVLLIHGLLVDGGLWDEVAARLIAAGHEVVVPGPAAGRAQLSDGAGGRRLAARHRAPRRRARARARPARGDARRQRHRRRDLPARRGRAPGVARAGSCSRRATRTRTSCRRPSARSRSWRAARRACSSRSCSRCGCARSAARRSASAGSPSAGVGDERAERWMRPFLDLPATRRDVVRTLVGDRLRRHGRGRRRGSARSIAPSRSPGRTVTASSRGGSPSGSPATSRARRSCGSTTPTRSRRSTSPRRRRS